MNIRYIIGILFLGSVQTTFSQYAPPAGEDGTTAIAKDSSIIINWASEVVAFNRGLEDITIPDGLYASFGDSTEALGAAEGTSVDVVSLGDRGSIVLTFPFSIRNEEGPDFAVFENSFSDDYLEFAHIEVSTDGERFVRLPSKSAIQTEAQTGSFGTSLAEQVHNLAGKYQQGYGTPFDLSDVADSSGIDVLDIRYVKVIDVVGSIDPSYGTEDSEGNLINDPFKTDFESGGFDLDGVAVIHSNNPSLTIDEFSSNQMLVYPNPTNGIVNVQATTPLKSISVYSLQGSLVKRVIGENSIDLRNSNLLNGMYITIVEDVEGNKKETKLVLSN